MSKEKALELVQSERGLYIIAQALYKAIAVMKDVPPAPRTEVSNIKDMEFILDNLFPQYKTIFEMQKGGRLQS